MTMLCSSERTRCSGRKFFGRCGPRLKFLSEGHETNFTGIVFNNQVNLTYNLRLDQSKQS